jgi:hypothetical protein
MSEPTDHHFVPVFYLKQWAGADNQVWEYSKVRGKLVSKRIGPRGTGFERHLYRSDALSADKAQFLEAKFLKKTDQEASLALQALFGGPLLPWAHQNHRQAWARFVYQLLIRHPEPFAEVRAASEQNWLQADGLTQQEYERRRTRDMPETWDEWAQTEPGLKDEMIISLLTVSMDNDLVCDRIKRLDWEVFDVGKAKRLLLTSDWPVENALGEANPFVAMPISPRHIFVGAQDPNSLASLRRRPATELVRTMNLFTVSRALRYVWTYDLSATRFIEKHMSIVKRSAPYFPSMIQRL